MKQTCEQYMEQFLELDKGQHIPLKLSVHLLFCKECRAQVRALTKAEQLAAQPLKVPAPVTMESITSAIQAQIPEFTQKKYKVPIPLWIVAGVFILLTLAVFSLLSNSIINGTLEFTTYLFFAIIICAYFVFFFGSNMDFFVKKIGTKKAA